MERYGVKIALLNEASVSDLEAANEAASRDGRLQSFVFSEEGTSGRDFWTDKHGVRKPYDRKKWSAAIKSPHGPDLLGEDDVRARAPLAGIRS